MPRGARREFKAEVANGWGVVAFVGFIVVALTWVPDWISPEGTNGTGNNREAIGTAGTGSTARMIQ